MKWRVLILLMAGIAMIYFVSLLQDTPYPHPVVIQTSIPKRNRINEPTRVILAIHDDYIYKTHIHYDAVLDANKGYIRGIDSIKAGVNGLVIQSRKRKRDLLNPVPEEEWEVCFKHLLGGPITSISKPAEGTELYQMAILYHVLENEEIKHFIRLYYWVNNDNYITTEYKDLLLPGSTMIHTISLEQDSILYSREPDIYRFRIIDLPKNIIDLPQSPILLTKGQTGDLAKSNYQPKETEMYTGLLSKLYSPNPNTYRVFSLDIHKTKKMFYTSVTITDGQTINEPGIKIGNWVHRDRFISKDKVMIDENLEYMAFSDGPHFHHEPIKIEMPKPSISRSKYGKTMVASLITNNFQTLDFTDNLDALLNDSNERKHLYKTKDGNILKEFYHSMQSVDTVEPSDTAYDATDIRGVQLNENGTLLAVWIKSKSVYIYKRGIADRTTSNGKKLFDSSELYLNSDSPHHLEKPLEWILRMVITPKEGQIGSITPIGAAIFWEQNNLNYISIGMKNNIVNTYLIDQVEEQKDINFTSFLKEKYDLWIVMVLVISIFVVNEYKTYLD